AFGHLVELLDGTRTVEQVLAARPDDLPEKALVRALTLLDAKGLLCDGAPAAPTASSDPLSRQLLFWGRNVGLTRQLASGEDAQEALARANVVVVATGLLGAATLDVLARSGATNLRTLAWDDPTFAVPPG